MHCCILLRFCCSRLVERRRWCEAWDSCSDLVCSFQFLVSTNVCFAPMVNVAPMFASHQWQFASSVVGCHSSIRIHDWFESASAFLKSDDVFLFVWLSLRREAWRFGFTLSMKRMHAFISKMRRNDHLHHYTLLLNSFSRKTI